MNWNWLFKKKLVKKEKDLLGLRKQTLDFLYDQASKEYRNALEAYSMNNPQGYQIHQMNHVILVNKFMRESAQYKLLESLKG